MIQTNPHSRKVDTHEHEAPARPYFAPGAIEGPHADNDFLKQEGALHAAIAFGAWMLIGIGAVACAALSIGYFGRHLGLF